MQHGIVETTASGTTTVTTRPAATSSTPVRSYSKVRELRSPPSSTSADTCCHYSLSGWPSSSSSTLSEQTLTLSLSRHQCHPLLTTNGIQSFTSQNHSVHSKYFPLNLHFVIGLIQKLLYSCYNMFTFVYSALKNDNKLKKSSILANIALSYTVHENCSIFGANDVLPQASQTMKEIPLGNFF